MGAIKDLLDKAFKMYCKMFGGGEDYWEKTMGLEKGEYPVQTWNAQYDVDISAGKQIGGALLGIKHRGKNLLVGITNNDRFAIAEVEDKENEPLVFNKTNKPKIEETKDRKLSGRMATTKGHEKAKSLTVFWDEDEVRIAVPESAAEQILAWVNS
ncbi:hypothetical protein A2230_02540 [candidate division WOR-1 bacterium RIFOXYA2_FULL_36_21]|uniref:Uncharacterized protein n=1 Tax=candidate division WOR-1 bacterium RIFOXYB2_FULL_36_35 TaxID=1802578 RepID=A0A1F4S6Y6_UNCSA|nr:MAG: hypothetical protein A2230_02540 [candidate division WOR-1 bacterium RIFOXYA2_FULL_36_21]OGC16184.1 MAG: hypothetical protein A2290_02900 [candidate division WOR-1 bacterium RIFOXYB2_FULL_36_35]OGC16901.1 MAG: hypothetical protein A2282_00600 [candidate division WOR-1 bacterium RIFOXYA12_FULL_36_13]